MSRMPNRRSLSRLDQALLTVTGRAARLSAGASRDIVLAGLDTTRQGFRRILFASGQLDKEDVDAAKDFFDGHPQAKHRVIVMHHPYDVPFEHGQVWDMNFRDPDAATVRNWLACTGATLVLCGHLHEQLERQLPGGARLVCNGDSGSEGGNECQDGSSLRSYSLIKLSNRRRATVVNREFSADELYDEDEDD